jgi:hypothetical protein
MKTITRLLLAILALTQAVFAQFPDRIDTTTDRLTSDNLSKIHWCTISAYSQSMIYDTHTKAWFESEYTSATPRVDEILGLISANNLDFQIARPEDDYIQIRVDYYDSDWKSLFFGFGGFRMERSTDGVWRVPTGGVDVEISPAESNLKIKNLVNAFFIERNSSGQEINWIHLPLNWDGSVTIPQYLRGKLGEIYFQTYDSSSMQSSTAVYDFATGNRITPTDVNLAVQGQFQGVQVVQPSGKILTGQPFQSYTLNGIQYGDSGIWEVEVSSTGYYLVDCRTTGGELHQYVTVKDVSTGVEVQYYRRPLDVWTHVRLEKGKTYHLLFGWSTFRPWSQYVQPYNGGGGVGVTTGGQG